MEVTDIIKEAVKVLKEGGVILYPTDTIWGIGCDATNPEAVEKVYKIKQRSDSKSLVVLASDMDMVAKYVQAIPNIAIDLVEVNDKPMTIVYPDALHSDKPERYTLASNVVSDEDGSVAMRIPMMDFCVQLVKRFGCPIVSTSANISGEDSPLKFADISEEIRSAVDFVVEPKLEKGSTGQASQIIKLEMDGRFKIIRQ